MTFHHYAKVVIDLEDVYRGAQRSISLETAVLDASGRVTLKSRTLLAHISQVSRHERIAHCMVGMPDRRRVGGIHAVRVVLGNRCLGSTVGFVDRSGRH
jgi:hypothetical protein